jgi:hypothetical protein
LGSFSTLIVMLVFAITKFHDGAYIVIGLIPLLVIAFSVVHQHYSRLAHQLSLENYNGPARIARHRVIMPIGGVHKGTLAALQYAKLLSDDITVVHVSIDPDEAERVRNKWEDWGDGYRLVILDSPYRLFIEPLIEYINEIETIRQPNEVITIVVPEFVPSRWWATILHTQTAVTLRMALLFHRGIVITSVPYLVK